MLVVLVIWLLVATFLFWRDFAMTRKALEVSLYPTVMGIIESRLLNNESSSSVDQNEERTQLDAKRLRWEHLCVYVWQGNSFEMATITPAHRTRDIAKLEEQAKLLTQLKSGRKLVVYVNPKQPREAYLYPGNAIFTWSYLWKASLFGYGIPIMGYVLYERFIQEASSNRPNPGFMALMVVVILLVTFALGGYMEQRDNFAVRDWRTKQED